MNSCVLDVLESPLYSEHAPVRLNVECGFALLLPLLLRFTNQHCQRTISLTLAVRSKSQSGPDAVTACAVRMKPSISLINL